MLSFTTIFVKSCVDKGSRRDESNGKEKTETREKIWERKKGDSERSGRRREIIVN